ncbi:putative heat shock protein 90 [Monocercomonoides exilis]|uniref:putative heat shock protein 90 n=1 Tax=Monocercomonoides exilis TaxID=2049356 RepID=UPI00355A48B9|nr:putative heat shock protein 90 [Monocercomonoides exilis]|eukprot:MONOS_1019.1-p1 / transcript=MONOS_1019.1 / gene=MONOS_1019 / organism=Monocercomonoides_exilis_PA203 / gene_product=heat shock protein 90 / transcript_product=heat shock protein 90 / location=Mono_scaffold00017:63762-67388(+) / protein_length=1193 / sequence_SO=supercontig / SO=protein_coding / is_pseudo=false
MFLFIALTIFAASCASPEKKTTKIENVTRVEFSADIARLMKLIVNSLYSNKEIFLRELISNSADALSKVKFEAKTNPAILGEGEMQKLEIHIIPDEDEQTLTIIDTGIGMSREELIQNLGTIAHSGTLQFFEKASNGSKDNDLIGQFGVGFYSAFLVADRVSVTSKRYNTTQNIWSSLDAQSYTIQEDTTGEDLGRGTKVKLYLKDPRFANSSIIQKLIQKYSQFVNYPIFVRFEKEDQWTYERKMKEDQRAYEEAERKWYEQFHPHEKLEETEKFDDENYNDEVPESVYEERQVNLLPPIWTRNPATGRDEDFVSREEYEDFFITVTNGAYRPDYPLSHLHLHNEDEIKFKTLLYIPPKLPAGRTHFSIARISPLRLYVKKVLVTEELVDFLPDYLTWARGVVEIEDLRDPLIAPKEGEEQEQKTKDKTDEEADESIALNVSREMLQESKALKLIAKKLARKLIEHVVALSERARHEESDEDVEAYDTFYREFQTEVKIGMREDEDNRMILAKLLRFNTSLVTSKSYSLDDYIEEEMQKFEEKEKEEAARNPNGTSSSSSSYRRRKENIPILYYAVDTENADKALSFVRQSPYLQPFNAENRNVLLLFEAEEEALLMRMAAFEGHPIYSVQDELRNKVREFEENGPLRKKIAQWRKDLVPLVNWATSVLSGKVDRVDISAKLAMGDWDRAQELLREMKIDEKEKKRLRAMLRRDEEELKRLEEFKKQKRGPGKKDEYLEEDEEKKEKEDKEKGKDTKEAKKVEKTKESSKHPPAFLADSKEKKEKMRKLALLDIKSIPCAVVAGEGALSSGMNRLYQDHHLASKELKERWAKRVFELNPASPLIQRMNKALISIQARKAAEVRGREERERAKAEGRAVAEGTPAEEEMIVTDEGELISPIASDMKKMEMMLMTMYETAAMNAGYGVGKKIAYSDRLFEVLSSMAGLPHAPVLPEDVDEDFEEWLEKEVEEEKEVKRKKKEERMMKLREKAEKKFDEEEMKDMTDDEKKEFLKKKKKAEKRKKKAQERKEEKKKKLSHKRPDDSYFDEVEEEEDPEDVMQRQLAERRKMRQKRFRDRMEMHKTSDPKKLDEQKQTVKEKTTMKKKTYKTPFTSDEEKEKEKKEKEKERKAGRKGKGKKGKKGEEKIVENLEAEEEEESKYLQKKRQKEEQMEEGLRKLREEKKQREEKQKHSS